jgi:hypothetical protein
MCRQGIAGFDAGPASRRLGGMMFDSMLVTDRNTFGDFKTRKLGPLESEAFL